MREDVLITVCDGQTIVAADLEQLRLQTANRSSKTVRVQSQVVRANRPAQYAKVRCGSENSV